MSEHKKEGLGSGGECICPKCATIIKHEQGKPCHDSKCPDCGASMLRKGSDHYNKWLEKQK